MSLFSLRSVALYTNYESCTNTANATPTSELQYDQVHLDIVNERRRRKLCLQIRCIRNAIR